MFDINISKTRVLNWFGHQVRSVQQEKSKSDTFKELGMTGAIWIRDWSQKYLPTRNHEAMSEYFGKTGISGHIDVFLRKRIVMKVTKQLKNRHMLLLPT